MASRIVKSPIVQAQRSFAAQAVQARSERELVKAESLKVTTLKNGLTVASIENQTPVTTLGVIIKAGSRNEDYSSSGMSHALRIAAGLGTTNHSAFGICRNIQQAGASLTCIQGREHTLYTIQATRDSTDVAIDYLADVVSNQAFKPWELDHNYARIKVELASRSPATQAVEMLHQVAFRSGLGNSLYCPAHKVGSHGTAGLQGFVNKHFTANRAALLGIGVSHASLTTFSELLSLKSGAGPSPVVTKYSGGEVRLETGGGLAYVALAANCAGAVNVADCLAAMLLQRVLGMGSHVKRSNGQGKLSQAAAAVTAEDHSVSSIGHFYSDAGLLGAMIISSGGSAGKIVEAVAAALRSAKVTDAEVSAAKKILLADVYTMTESPINQIENIGSQILLSGDVMPGDKIPQLISGITTADVQAAAAKLSSSQLSLAAVGNLSTVPHLDSL